MIKTPNCLFIFIFLSGVGRKYVGLLPLTSLDSIFPQIAPHGWTHVCPPFPMAPGLAGENGSACLGTGITGTNVLTSLTTSTPPLPKAKWRVLWGASLSRAVVPLEESASRDIVGKEGRFFSSF